MVCMPFGGEVHLLGALCTFLTMAKLCAAVPPGDAFFTFEAVIHSTKTFKSS